MYWYKPLEDSEIAYFPLSASIDEWRLSPKSPSFLAAIGDRGFLIDLIETAFQEGCAYERTWHG